MQRHDITEGKQDRSINMRKVQITMNVLMVDDAASNGTCEQIRIYADANSVYEAAASAFQELMTALEESRNVPTFGQKTHCLQDALATETGNAQERKSMRDRMAC